MKALLRGDGYGGKGGELGVGEEEVEVGHGNYLNNLYYIFGIFN